MSTLSRLTVFVVMSVLLLATVAAPPATIGLAQATYTCPCSIWPGPVTPAFSYDNPSPIELGLKFRSDVAGYVTGVRFFKATGATGTHIGRLWTTTGVKLAEVTFANETASGWQTATFPSQVSIQANTTYIISYYVGDGNRRFSDTLNYFTTSGTDNVPLHALKSGVDGPNEVYGENGGPLTSTYQDSNYWVDLIFSNAANTTPPTVLSVAPANSATGVAVSSTVTATFSEALDPTTVTTGTFLLTDPTNAVVPASVSYNNANLAAALVPTYGLSPSTTYSGRLVGGANGIKDTSGNALVADYTWSFTTSPVDTIPPSVVVVTPLNNSANLWPATSVTVSFSEAMNPLSINTSSVELVDPAGNRVAAAVTYDGTAMSALLRPSTPLNYSTTYTARVHGGVTGVQDASGNPLVADYVWSFSTTAQRPAFDQGPGGPILAITSSANQFTRYLGEILRAEGLNEFAAVDVTQVTTQTLAAYDIVVLGDMGLTASQVSMLTNWVNGGGHLIAMRPDKQLAGLLGLSDAGSVLGDGYLQVDGTQPPGVGIVAGTIQFHGTADEYRLNGATSLATLYKSTTAGTQYPAVSLKAVGPNGGLAAAFTFDLARSVIYMRQGNPAWQLNHVNPFQGYGTALDLFYNWPDFSRIAVPQADEEQRFLANLILYMNASKKPLPRFWYFPSGNKAVVILTGDDHTGRPTLLGMGNPDGNTTMFFERQKQQSAPGCSVADWQCIRSSSYMYTGSAMTDTLVAAYTAAGFEIGIHLDAGLAQGIWCGTWPSDPTSTITSQVIPFMTKYASIAAPASSRSHCYSWFGYNTSSSMPGYAAEPAVEASQGIRLDTNIDYGPSNWATVYPGYPMGSLMPMRFAQVDLGGTMRDLLDIYNAGTQLTDDSIASAAAMRTDIDSFLNAATGPQGYYGAVVANTHSDDWYGWSYQGADQIIASAQAHGVPVVSGRQMVDWLDGRNNSSFGSLTWNGQTLSFNVVVGNGARNLTAMVPATAGSATLASITLNGSPVSFTTQTIKGVSYAFFPATAGAYAATYTAAPAPTSTPTPTGLPPTSTPTPTGLPPTSTPTPTGLPPTSTPTPTSLPPTSTPTPTNTLAPTATSTPTPVPPAAPSSLSATTASTSRINLAWTDNANNESGFKIERCRGANCTNFSQIATVGANVTSYASTGLASGTTYRYRVRAYNSGGNSAYSNIAAATTN